MSQTVLEPKTSGAGQTNGRWKVVIYNNDSNSMDEVVYILVKATHCDLEEAAIETWEAHTYGQANVHFDTRETCEGAAAIISSIGVRTEVTKEWELD